MMDTPYFHVASRALVAGEVFSRWVGHDWMALIVTSGIEPSCPLRPGSICGWENLREELCKGRVHFLLGQPPFPDGSLRFLHEQGTPYGVPVV